MSESFYIVVSDKYASDPYASESDARIRAERIVLSTEDGGPIHVCRVIATVGPSREVVWTEYEETP
jgi:hypothetical protein